jgi:hypothetical protein
MARATTLDLTFYDSEDREVEIKVRYYPGSGGPYWDRGIGVWLPGDDAEVDVLSTRAVDVGADIEEVLRKADLHEACYKALERYDED